MGEFEGKVMHRAGFPCVLTGAKPGHWVVYSRGPEMVIGIRIPGSDTWGAAKALTMARLLYGPVSACPTCYPGDQ